LCGALNHNLITNNYRLLHTSHFWISFFFEYLRATHIHYLLRETAMLSSIFVSLWPHTWLAIKIRIQSDSESIKGLLESNKKINLKIADPRHRHLLFYYCYDIRRKSIRLHSQSSSITISPHFGQIARAARIEFWKARLVIRPHI